MNELVTAAQLDSCTLEPIHIPGSIQPHGALLVLNENDLTCLQASANCGEFLGSEFAGMVGRKLSDAAPGAATTITQALAGASETLASPITMEIGQKRFDVSLHRTEAGLIIEFEAAGPNDIHFHRQL